MRHLTFYLRLYLWFCLRNLWRNPVRTATVLLGIALGAAVFTSVRLSVHASLDSFTRSMDRLAGEAEHVLIRPGGYVPEQVISTILRDPSVSAASPLLTTYVLSAEKESEPFLLVGLDPILDRSFRSWQVPGQSRENWLDLLRTPYTLIMGDALARNLGLGPNDRLTLDHTQQTADFLVLGVLSREGLAGFEGGRVALTDIATFQEFTGLHGWVDRIDLRLKPGAGAADLDALRKNLPVGIVVTAPSADRDSGRQMIGAYQLNLSILSFASLFVGMFLVYSLVALNAASRRRELAILRSLGGSPQLLFVLFLAEGAFFGAGGWLIAIPISTLMTKYLLHGVSQTIATLFVRVNVETLTLTGWEIALSFGLTLCVSVLAAFQPAREAMRVAPKEAMEIAQHGVRRRNAANRPALWGLATIAVVLPLSRLPDFRQMPLGGYLAMFLLFIGFSMTAPWILERLGRVCAPLLYRLAGISAYLGSRYVSDSGTRTAVSVGALLTAVALFVSLVIMIHSFRGTVELWTQQTVSGDLYLTTKMGELNRFRYLIPQPIVKKLQRLDADADLVPNRRFQLTHGAFPFEFEVSDIERFSNYGGFVWLKGNPETVLPLLIRGEGVLVSEVYANRTGRSVGDLFRAQVEGSLVELPVLGVVRDYRTNGGVVFYSLNHFKNRYHDPGWSGVRFFIRNRDHNREAAVSALQKEIVFRCGPHLDMISGEALRGAVLRVFDETFAVTSILLFIALVIAALGIATTLSVLILERSRQLNTLFAVGAGFGQIRSMIFWEAAFMVTVGEGVGLVCGFLLSHLLVFVINRQSFGWTFLYRVDWSTMGLSAPLIILAAVVAALPALRLVFREPPATLLRER